MSELIDRDALICHIRKKGDGYLKEWDTGGVLIAIEEVPTVDPVKHGKWITIYEDVYDMFRCSNCKCDEFNKTPYCPQCGAHMNLSEKPNSCDGANMKEEVSTDVSEDDYRIARAKAHCVSGGMKAGIVVAAAKIWYN